MITLHEAYLKAKAEGEKYDRTYLKSCRDFGAFWGFMYEPPAFALELSPEDAPNGSAYIAINKKTGEISYFNVIMDLDLVEKSTSIPVEQFDEYRIAV